MAAVDHETLIIERLWVLLEAHVPFTDLVRVANRIKLVANADAPPIKIDPVSFPKVLISVASISDTLFVLGESYAMRPAASFNPVTQGVTEDLTFNVAIDILHDVSFARARQLCAEIMTVLRKAGPALGITAFRIQRVGPVTQSNSNSFGGALSGGNPGVAGARPVATTVNLPVLVRVKSTDMLV